MVLVRLLKVGRFCLDIFESQGFNLSNAQVSRAMEAGNEGRNVNFMKINAKVSVIFRED